MHDGNRNMKVAPQSLLSGNDHPGVTLTYDAEPLIGRVSTEAWRGHEDMWLELLRMRVKVAADHRLGYSGRF